jgi:hypothetical protein
MTELFEEQKIKVNELTSALRRVRSHAETYALAQKVYEAGPEVERAVIAVIEPELAKRMVALKAVKAEIATFPLHQQPRLWMWWLWLHCKQLRRRVWFSLMTLWRRLLTRLEVSR